MAHLYRPTITRYLDAAGRRVSKGTPGARKKKLKSKIWRGKYRTPDGIVHNVKLCQNKEAARQMLADRVRKAERQEAGLVDPHRNTAAGSSPNTWPTTKSTCGRKATGKRTSLCRFLESGQSSKPAGSNASATSRSPL